MESEQPEERELNPREQVAEGLKEAVSTGLPENSVLIGWVMVAEFIDPQGGRMLVRMDGSADERDLPEWQRDGYLLNGLKSDWGEERV